ncbi:MAG: Mov34/MPN/PAD-1 family protein [Myxococcota bacterium]
MERDNWSDDILDEIVDWLEQAYPVEGCGLVLEKDGERRFLATDNLADKYHEMDPEEFPRTAREFYIIDPREFIRAEDRGERVAVVVHSHADVGDYFSEEDVNAATMPRDSDDEPLEPSHPGADFLVVSTREDGADHATLFRFDEDEQGFPAVLEIEIDDGEYRFSEPD